MNIYLITNLINGKQYIGVEKKYKPEYFGSGKLVKEAIKKFDKENFKKEILIEDKYIDNWEECLRLESACILSFNTLRPNGYNQKVRQWPPSIEARKRGGKIGGRKIKRLKIGMFAPGMASKGGKIGGSKAGKIGGKIGGRISGKKQAKLGIGMFAPGMQSKSGKIGGKMHANVWFEIDGLIQQMTLGKILKGG